MDKIVVGIPAYCERSWIEKTLDCLALQTDVSFEVWVHVNQPAAYLHDPKYAAITQENLGTITYLEARRGQDPFQLHVIDGVERYPLIGKGVGPARAKLFQMVQKQYGDRFIGISLDADTLCSDHYIAAVAEAFQRFPNAKGLVAPYYHHLPQEPEHALRLLRYEIYMRYYQINLWRIGSPYAFLALGSALAFRGKAYRGVGGFPKRDAGEDFYFLQQLRKTGPLIRWIDAHVYPASRPSNRVPFGTGPLIADNSMEIQEERFPFYHMNLFEKLHTSFQQFPQLFKGEVTLPIDQYLQERFNDPFRRIRKNFKREDLFVKACHEKIDALRTLQCLRYYMDQDPEASMTPENINVLLEHLDEPSAEIKFDIASIPALNQLRNRLCAIEANYQKAMMQQWNPRARW